MLTIENNHEYVWDFWTYNHPFIHRYHSKDIPFILSFQRAIICEIWRSRAQLIGPREVKVPNRYPKGTHKQANHSFDFWKKLWPNIVLETYLIIFLIILPFQQFLVSQFEHQELKILALEDRKSRTINMPFMPSHPLNWNSNFISSTCIMGGK